MLDMQLRIIDRYKKGCPEVENWKLHMYSKTCHGYQSTYHTTHYSTKKTDGASSLTRFWYGGWYIENLKLSNPKAKESIKEYMEQTNRKKSVLNFKDVNSQHYLLYRLFFGIELTDNDSLTCRTCDIHDIYISVLLK